MIGASAPVASARIRAISASRSRSRRVNLSISSAAESLGFIASHYSCSANNRITRKRLHRSIFGRWERITAGAAEASEVSETYDVFMIADFSDAGVFTCWEGGPFLPGVPSIPFLAAIVVRKLDLSRAEDACGS